jgi:hypothetical protein
VAWRFSSGWTVNNHLLPLNVKVNGRDEGSAEERSTRCGASFNVATNDRHTLEVPVMNHSNQRSDARVSRTVHLPGKWRDE